MAEGCEVIPLMAPARVEVNTQEDVVGLWVQPQMIGMVQRGRPAPRKANKPEELIAADVIIVAIGQDIEIAPFFEAAGIPVERAWFKADRACVYPVKRVCLWVVTVKVVLQRSFVQWKWVRLRQQILTAI